MTTKTEEHAQSVRSGLVGALGALINLGTPFLRNVRSRWGLALEEARRAYPGDDLVPKPTWMWTHAVEIDVAVADVWPWLVQIGQDKAGFYSYTWLENLAGCQIHNSNVIEAAWQKLKVGDPLKVHPKVPPLTVAAIEPGRWFVVTSDTWTQTAPGATPEAHVSWLFLLESLGINRCRLISRFRVDYQRGWRTRLSYGPWLTESLGFVMDRAMLLGVKKRAEGRQ